MKILKSILAYYVLSCMAFTSGFLIGVIIGAIKNL
ncbi:hypothetical protein SADIYA_2 [Escherichia phage vB_EcoD_Sadiya]|uniref:Uncharacterized protein n=1 Tax=Escherichia phage vB_EcoD_Sadiya TaxID=2902684 RepID=A0AC61TRE5_9CAUD|nr:hypothetical protein OPT719_2 [Escherichia phage vB_EcoD_Opt-719]UGV22524.1 hypothetical protein PHLEASOLO_2 [Escherichia phage vB_ EcoD_Phleasolo]UGV22693.1 hypothetical protein SADIYA_2 [Escherichia phage vB_EcoD_Sadiya]